jgi:hypothetical protein
MIAVVYRSRDAGDAGALVRELAAQIARHSGKRVPVVDGCPQSGRTRAPRLSVPGACDQVGSLSYVRTPVGSCTQGCLRQS